MYRYKRFQRESVSKLWEQNPFFFISLCILCALSFFYGLYLFSFLQILFLTIFQKKNYLISVLVIFFLTILYLCITSFLQKTPFEMAEGSGIFQVEKEYKSYNRYGKKSYRVCFLHFFPNSQKPSYHFTSFIKLKNQTLKEKKLYFFEGSIKKNTTNFLEAFPKNYYLLNTQKNLHSFRVTLHNFLEKFIRKKTHTPKNASLLSALLTGTMKDRILNFSFSKLGLAHLLAISGFHFLFFIQFFSKIFKFFPWKMHNIFLLIVAFSYFIFMGYSPSVFRAWLMLSLFLFSKLIEKKSSALNLISFAFLVEFLLRPSVLFHLGFQLSYLCCLAIFLFFPPIDTFLSQFIRNREPSTLGLLEKPVYYCNIFFRQSLSLSIAISLWTLPIVLFHFHKFPLLGIVYNFFIPALIGFLMLFLFVSLCVHVVLPFFSKWVFFFLESYTKQVLILIEYPPAAIDFSIYATISKEITFFSACLFLYLGIFLKAKKNNLSLGV